MNEPKKPVNPAKAFLFKYIEFKLDRFSYMANENVYKLHADDVAVLEAGMKEIDGVIKRVDDPFQREILRLRYECGWPWRRIIYRMEESGIGERMCYNLHGRALQKVNKILSERESVQ